MVPPLPIHALPFFGPDRAGDWGGVPWARAEAHIEHLQGLWKTEVFEFPNRSGVLFSSDADIDVDGPGGSKAVDPCWLPGTSLRNAAGHSLDSRHFPGVVMSPVLRAFGVRLGDFCLLAWAGRVRAGQVYDTGPTAKIGEVSVYLGRQLSLVAPSESDHHAATAGNSATDVVTLIFPGSGPGHALAPDLITEAAHGLFARLRG